MSRISLSQVDTELRVLLAFPPLAEVLKLLNPQGEETRLVGGAVRDALLALPLKDIDLATTLLPQQVGERAQNAGWSVYPTGLKHGTLTLVKNGQSFEVTTLREDVETDGRHANVRFCRDFRVDALRRDFTINALSLSQKGELHDYTGGLADLKHSIVRFIGEPNLRLREDYLRGLRFLRFSASYGKGRLDQPSFHAVLQHQTAYLTLARERIRQEVLKFIMAPFFLPVLEKSEENGLLKAIIGLPCLLDRLKERMNLTASAPPNLLTRLAFLWVQKNEDLTTLRDHLRLTNLEQQELKAFLSAYQLALSADPLRHFLLRDGAPHWAEEAFLAALHDAPRLHAEKESFFARKDYPRFLITGQDAHDMGVPPSAALGAALKAAKRLWATQGYSENRDDQKICLIQSLGDAKKD